MSYSSDGRNEETVREELSQCTKESKIYVSQYCRLLSQSLMQTRLVSDGGRRETWAPTCMCSMSGGAPRPSTSRESRQDGTNSFRHETGRSTVDAQLADLTVGLANCSPPKPIASQEGGGGL